MKPQYIGIGSYVALALMVFVAMNNAPAYVVLIVGISVGMAAALVLSPVALTVLEGSWFDS